LMEMNKKDRVLHNWIVLFLVRMDKLIEPIRFGKIC
jgi:hypothetical protein